MSHLNSLCSDCPPSMELDIGVTHSDLALAESWFPSDTSTGYLEDAIAGRGIPCKEQKLSSCSQDQKVDQFPTCFSTTAQQLHELFGCRFCGHKDYCFTCGKKFITGNLSSSQSDTHAAAIKHEPPQRSCASKSHWIKIAYPFEWVKPGGVDGETTLKEINQQILMIPAASKPIPHPVGDSLTHPCISARGFGMSGKAVASVTRIHTQGSGSITIIRTKD